MNLSSLQSTKKCIIHIYFRYKDGIDNICPPRTVSLTGVSFIPVGITLNTKTNGFYFVSRRGTVAPGSYIYYWDPSNGGTVTILTNNSFPNPDNLNGDTGYNSPLLLYANDTLYVITQIVKYNML